MENQRSEVLKFCRQLDKKLTKNNLEVVYKELNQTIIDTYFEKYTVKQIKEFPEDKVTEEIIDMLEKFLQEPPFSLLVKKMNDDDFCLQAALISKFILEN